MNIALNKAVGDWEPQALADLPQELQLSGYDVGATGFDAAEVDDLFSRVHDKDVKDDECELDADTEGLNFRKAFKEAGVHISGVCVWVKNSLVPGRSPYQWQREPVLFGWLPNGQHKWFFDRKQTTVWNFDKPKRSREHPTMKPIPLLAYPIKNSSAPNVS